ncbi:hypothetical protein MAR_002652 [Mya arenaria]|uniref:Uncharacterized protein n=1 Tax=Mya arenaria TaxID=6604 RepID=A0ABY7G6D0_MYAAR|nr:hypothetical protein MAR_002652 [Mya arenaria]
MEFFPTYSMEFVNTKPEVFNCWNTFKNNGNSQRVIVPPLSLSSFTYVTGGRKFNCRHKRNCLYFTSQKSICLLTRQPFCFLRIRSPIVGSDRLRTYTATDITNSQTLQSIEGTTEKLVERYNTGLQELLDKHAPLQTKVITIRQNTPWYNDSLRAAKRNRRKAERKMRKSNLTVHTEIYKEPCIIYNKLMLQTKKDYYLSKIEENSNDRRHLFKLTNTLMGCKRDTVLPSTDNDKSLANKFCDFFIGKIISIRNKLSENQTDNVVLRADKPERKRPRKRTSSLTTQVNEHVDHEKRFPITPSDGIKDYPSQQYLILNSANNLSFWSNILPDTNMQNSSVFRAQRRSPMHQARHSPTKKMSKEKSSMEDKLLDLEEKSMNQNLSMSLSVFQRQVFLWTDSCTGGARMMPSRPPSTPPSTEGPGRTDSRNVSKGIYV